MGRQEIQSQRPGSIGRNLLAPAAGDCNRVRIGVLPSVSKSCLGRIARADICGKACKPQRAGDPRKKHGSRWQLCLAMSEIGSGSQCLHRLGITAPLNVGLTATTAHGGTAGPAEPKSVAQPKAAQKVRWFDPLGLRRELAPS